MSFLQKLVDSSVAEPNGGGNKKKILTKHQKWLILSTGLPISDAKLSALYNKDGSDALLDEGDEFRRTFKAKTTASLNPCTGEVSSNRLSFNTYLYSILLMRNFLLYRSRKDDSHRLGSVG